ncbi:MAG: hypothetical protein LQ342_002947 [Letrouitia transgressa]|nr:MAG: hypothetical protein LQ342_002947 [Letrouitia transgressa]
MSQFKDLNLPVIGGKDCEAVTRTPEHEESFKIGENILPGHEYTKQNVKFLTTVLQNEAVLKLQSFADKNKETQGKFTIGDEKVDALE